MLQAVIFDLDGTLYNKKKLPFRLALKQLLRGKLHLLGRERSARKQLKGIDFENKENFYSAFFNCFSNPDRARKWYFQTYLPDMVTLLRHHHHINPWVKDYVTALREKGIRIAVFSDYGFVEKKLEAIGFSPKWADYLFDAPEMGGLKPCKNSFLKVCGAMRLHPQDCVMIGDRTDTDGAGAAAAGIPFVLVKGDSPAPNIGEQ